MGRKKYNNKNFPYADFIQKLKEEFKASIDELSDEEFLDLITFLMFSSDDFDEDELLDDDLEDDEDFDIFYDEPELDFRKHHLDDDSLPF